MFRVGQKVVCVKDDELCDGLYFDRCGLKKGEVYTVRWAGVYSHPYRLQEDHYCVKLEEILRKFDDPAYYDLPFAALRFRPIVERKTSIEVFEKLLSPTSPRKVTEDA